MKTLKKKQKEVTQKHKKAEGGESFITEDSGNNKYMDNNDDEEIKRGGKHSFSDDSDLASLAREFEEEEIAKESPFIRKVMKLKNTLYHNIFTPSYNDEFLK